MVEQSNRDATTKGESGGVTPYVILSGLTAASSGLVFGYNIGISGIRCELIIAYACMDGSKRKYN